MMKLRLSQSAEKDAANAVAWYNEQRDELGDEFLDELERLFEFIESGPRRYPIIGGTSPNRELRHAPMRRFPYRVVYEVKSRDSLLVLAVVHARRHPDHWKKRGND